MRSPALLKTELRLALPRSITLDGRTVVDLWGGLADSASGQAWTQDTIVPVFSVSKGVAAICVVATGHPRIDRPGRPCRTLLA
ncbi:serine hydrolase domain-containing protein [Sphingomonas aerolata]|uniref:serine hydrolase domain-containing protein n=1 Tax=Sphingomonas aerolata TaxID=185951 RepID=UPI003A5C3F14